MRVFRATSSQVILREDPHYNLPIFLTISKRLRKSLYSKKQVKDIVYFIRSGATPTAKGRAYTNREKGIPFLRVSDIKNYEIDLSKVLFIKREIHEGMLKRTQLESDDVLLSMAGTIGLSTVVKPDLGEININQAIARLKPIKGLVNPHFLKLFFNTKLGSALSDRESTVSNQPNINLKQIGSLQIPLPDLQTQSQIVDFFNSANQKIGFLQKQADEKLASIDSYILDELGIKMPKFEDKMSFAVKSGDITEREDPQFFKEEFKQIDGVLKKSKYPVVNLGKLSQMVDNGVTPAKNEYARADQRQVSDKPILKAKNLSNRGIKWNNLDYIPDYVYNSIKFRAKVYERDILVLAAAHSPEYIGSNVDIVDEIPQEIGRDLVSVGELITIRVQETVSPFYVVEYLRSWFGKRQMRRYVSGQTAHIYPNDIKKILIPNPPKIIQNKIANKIVQIMKDAKELSFQAGQLKQITNDTVEKLILGEISLSEAQNLIKNQKIKNS